MYIASHGSKGSFILNDGIRSYGWLDSLLDKIPAKVTIVIDACYSGSAIPHLGQPGREVYVACGADELSTGEYDKRFAEALGGTEADVDGNGVVEMWEADVWVVGMGINYHIDKIEVRNEIGYINDPNLLTVLIGGLISWLIALLVSGVILPLIISCMIGYAMYYVFSEWLYTTETHVEVTITECTIEKIDDFVIDEIGEIYYIDMTHILNRHPEWENEETVEEVVREIGENRLETWFDANNDGPKGAEFFLWMKSSREQATQGYIVAFVMSKTLKGEKIFFFRSIFPTSAIYIHLKCGKTPNEDETIPIYEQCVFPDRNRVDPIT